MIYSVLFSRFFFRFSYTKRHRARFWFNVLFNEPPFIYSSQLTLSKLNAIKTTVLSGQSLQMECKHETLFYLVSLLLVGFFFFRFDENLLWVRFSSPLSIFSQRSRTMQCFVQFNTNLNLEYFGVLLTNVCFVSKTKNSPQKWLNKSFDFVFI